jgi:hypothetical protein
LPVLRNGYVVFEPILRGNLLYIKYVYILLLAIFSQKQMSTVGPKDLEQSEEGITCELPILSILPHVHEQERCAISTEI